MDKLTMTAEEYVDTLTGYDEIAIEKHLGFDFYEAAEAEKNVKLLRAIVFVQATREDQPPRDAVDTALSMTTGQLNDLFPEAEPDAVEQLDAGESGNGGGAGS